VSVDMWRNVAASDSHQSRCMKNMRRHQKRGSTSSAAEKEETYQLYAGEVNRELDAWMKRHAKGGQCAAV